MPNYVQKALKQFQHKAGKLQHAPYQSAQIQYEPSIDTIRNTRIEGATIRQQSQAVHPTGMRQVFISWQSS
jgi:hypothetical protein